jgi:hypothetical protein
MDVAINEDGTLKAQAGQATNADVQGIIGQGNWIANDNFLIWPGATGEAPAYWTLTTLTIARETTTKKIAAQSAKLTRSGSDGSLSQNLMNSTSFTANGAYYKGKTFAFGAWLYTSVASCARLQFNDGVTTTETSYHTGGGGWEWIAGTHTVSNSGTTLQVLVQVLNSNGDVFVNGVTATVSEDALGITEWMPARTVIGTIIFKAAGTISAATTYNKDRFGAARPFIVLDTRMNIVTAPTGADLIIDINQWDGSAWQSMYTTKPEIAASATKSVVAKPDGTVFYRSFKAGFGTTIQDTELAWDVDQVGSGTAGADMMVYIRTLQYMRPQEALLDLEDV